MTEKQKLNERPKPLRGYPNSKFKSVQQGPLWILVNEKYLSWEEIQALEEELVNLRDFRDKVQDASKIVIKMDVALTNLDDSKIKDDPVVIELKKALVHYQNKLKKTLGMEEKK